MNLLKTSALILIASLIFCALQSCAAIKDGVEAATTERVKTAVSSKLPESDQAAFEAKWDENPAAAIRYAVGSLTAEELADLLEKASSDNKELADQVRAGNEGAVKDLWVQIAIALVGGAGTLFGLKKSSTTGKILNAVIKGVQGYISTGSDIKAAIKSEANAAGVKPALDVIVAKVTK